MKFRWLSLLVLLPCVWCLWIVQGQTPRPSRTVRPPVPATRRPRVTTPAPTPVIRRPRVATPVPVKTPVRRPRVVTGPPATTPAPLPEVREVRALWVVRTTLTTPDKIRKMVSDAANAGFNTLIVQIRGRGDAYYQSRWEPRASTLNAQPTTFDPLALVISEAQRRRLRVHGWINTHLIADMDSLPAAPQHIYQAHPEWLAVPREVASDLYNMPPADPRYRARIVEWTKRNRQQVEGLFTSPANPAVSEHLASVWLDVLEKYQLDGLHFDFIRYSSADFDYSRTAMERFREWLEPHLTPEASRTLIEATRVNALAATELFPEKFADFQRAQITNLVERISIAVRKRKPQTTISAAVFANGTDAYDNRFQDWPRWLASGYIDVVCPMAYTPDTNTFRQQIETATNAAHSNGAKIWAGIGAYRQPVSGTVEKIQTARTLGTDGISLFSYDFAATPSTPNNVKGDYLKQVQSKVF